MDGKKNETTRVEAADPYPRKQRLVFVSFPISFRFGIGFGFVSIVFSTVSSFCSWPLHWVNIRFLVSLHRREEKHEAKLHHSPELGFDCGCCLGFEFAYVLFCSCTNCQNRKYR